MDKHVEMVCKLPLVNKEVIEKANFKVAVDAVNSTGGIAIPKMLRALGVKDVLELNCEPTGKFAHTPEPLAQNLTDICRYVKEQGCDFGVVVDPDVDRLVFVKEDGELFGEEYTLVSVADFILKHTPGPTVSNLSQTRALRDVTQKHGQQ
jgi:phosphomannomutase